MQLRFGQLEKHLKSSLPALKGVWKGKIKKTTFQALNFFLSICQLEGSPIATALWAAGKASEKLTACSQGCLEGKVKKTTFQALNFFLSICQLEGSPIATALWAAGKAPEKLTACSQGCLEGKVKKTTFQALKSCFLKFAVGRVSHCNCALCSWKSTCNMS